MKHRPPICWVFRRQVRPAHRGFSLVELLAAIVIMGILAALVTPVVNRARESAMQAACMGNMRQVSVAIYAYIGDSGYLPYSITAQNSYDWDNLLVEAGILHDTKLTRQGCPKSKSKLAATYGFNYMQLGNEYPGVLPVDRTHQVWGRRRLCEVEKPAETIMLTDGHDMGEKPDPTKPHAGWPSVVYWDDRFWPTSSGKKEGNKGSMQPIGHNGGVNIIWVDGHASWMRGVDAWGLKEGPNANSFYYFARVKSPSSL